MKHKYESRFAGDRWWPIEPSTTVDGRLVEWMEENEVTFVSADLAGMGMIQARRVS